MRSSTFGAVGLVMMVAAGLGFSGRQWSVSHVRRMIGRNNTAGMTCYNCHLVSTNQLPWAKARPHHDSPTGLAVSPDGRKIYIALDDRDEIAEADIATH